MTTTPMTQQPRHDGRSKLGRPARYGEAAVQRPVYWPRALLARLQEEAAWKSAREGNPEAWSVSSLVVEIVAEHLGMDLPHQEPSNGR